MAERQLHLFRGPRQRGTAAPPPPEFNLHCLVADTLRRWATPGWLWTHFPAGELRQPITAARLQRMGVQRGWPDFLLLAPGGRPHALELKRRKSGRLTDEQAAFGLWCECNHCPFACVDWYPDALPALGRGPDRDRDMVTPWTTRTYARRCSRLIRVAAMTSGIGWRQRFTAD